MANAGKALGRRPGVGPRPHHGREASIFVRDRGRGFDRAAVPDDRRGLRDSIDGRMERPAARADHPHGPGEGTEIELVLPRTS